ncbi:hypothetical protein [Sphingobacterium sp. GVS05A]|uniref:hypothetical protein n=1 Tax=Sphingobacterium sp. GVS05A TaxID=2862679 RepID=UPI001CC09C3F|nr:hypothetical protein [Sphingobacterium sp. GVS05A]
MRIKLLLTFYFFIAVQSSYAQKAKVVILGVGHSTQLINYNQQPAAIRAFIDKVKPSAICIERSPEEFSRNDFYEFTYEQQYTTIPYARENKIPLHPIDWLPSDKDIDLAFGLKDLEIPKFTRQKNGFLGFTTFTEKDAFEEGLYFADDKKHIDSIASWYTNHPPKNAFDFPRRLFLYRTFLQSRRIQKVLEDYSMSDTILVVIGAFHKNDIEKNLEQNGYEIIQPNTFGAITDEEMRKHFTQEDAYAILSFNLLGMQSQLNKVNKKLIDLAFEYLKETNTIEKQFFTIKNASFTNAISSKQCISEYLSLLDKANNEKFTWIGVKDFTRVDSYFDPFGNLSLAKRIRLELAREYRKLLKEKEFTKEIAMVLNGLNDYKKQMLNQYIEQYLF